MLRVRKLVAQRGYSVPDELCGDGCHEGMSHSCAGTVRQYIAGPCVGRVLQQAGNANALSYCDADGLGNRRRHEAIPANQAPSSSSVSPKPGRATRVSSNSVTVITPGAGSSTTSTTTFSIAGVGGFIRCSFFRAALLAPARLGLALAIVRFVPPARRLDTLRVLPRAAEPPLRTFARFFGCTFVRFFRLAIINPLPIC
jgi:hypothetical protein